MKHLIVYISLLSTASAFCSLLNPHLDKKTSPSNNFSIELDFETAVDAISINQSSGINNTYIGEISKISTNLKFGDSTGFFVDILSDKNCSNYRNAELYKTYAYHIFDCFGELRIGNDRSASYYNSLYKSIGYSPEINGSYVSYFNNKANAYLNKYPIDDSIATKVLWISPIIHGFKISASYTPDTSMTHFFYKIGDNHANFSKNVISACISYQRGENVGFSHMFSISGSIGKAKENNVHSLKIYSMFACIGYDDLQLEFRLTDNCDSLCNMSEHINSGKICEINMHYKIKNTKLLLGHYFSIRNVSKFENSKAKIYRACIEHDFTEKLKYYVEYRRIKSYKIDNSDINSCNFIASGIKYALSSR